LFQRATAVQLALCMSNRLDPKDAFAFGIDLQRQLAAVQLEDRQIIRRSLDRDFPFGRPLGSAVDFRTMRGRLGAARAKTPATTSNPSPSSKESANFRSLSEPGVFESLGRNLPPMLSV